MNPFVGNIEEETINNKYFRKVLFTGEHEQLVVMSLKPGEDIGEETHDTIDQFLRFESGKGKAIIDGKEYEVKDGVALIIPAGSKHNIINTSDKEPLKLYTIYSSQQHPKDAKFSTKEEAMNEEEHIEKAYDQFKHKSIKKVTRVKMKDKTKKQKEKFDSCVEQVKAKGDNVNPYAVCNVSVLGNTGETKKSKPFYYVPEDIMNKGSKKPDKPSIARKECPVCGAEMQAGFDDVCWNCGNDEKKEEEEVIDAALLAPDKEIKPKKPKTTKETEVPKKLRKIKIVPTKKSTPWELAETYDEENPPIIPKKKKTYGKKAYK
jgi:mannose-6-phosphate isomerase-like protein (cupin superfamily)